MAFFKKKQKSEAYMSKFPKRSSQYLGINYSELITPFSKFIKEQDKIDLASLHPPNKIEDPNSKMKAILIEELKRFDCR